MYITTQHYFLLILVKRRIPKSPVQRLRTLMRVTGTNAKQMASVSYVSAGGFAARGSGLESPRAVSGDHIPPLLGKIHSPRMTSVLLLILFFPPFNFNNSDVT